MQAKFTVATASHLSPYTKSDTWDLGEFFKIQREESLPCIFELRRRTQMRMLFGSRKCHYIRVLGTKAKLLGSARMT